MQVRCQLLVLSARSCLFEYGRPKRREGTGPRRNDLNQGSNNSGHDPDAAPILHRPVRGRSGRAACSRGRGRASRASASRVFPIRSRPLTCARIERGSSSQRFTSRTSRLTVPSTTGTSSRARQGPGQPVHAQIGEVMHAQPFGGAIRGHQGLGPVRAGVIDDGQAGQGAFGIEDDRLDAFQPLAGRRAVMAQHRRHRLDLRRRHDAQAAPHIARVVEWPAGASSRRGCRRVGTLTSHNGQETGKPERAIVGLHPSVSGTDGWIILKPAKAS